MIFLEASVSYPPKIFSYDLWTCLLFSVYQWRHTTALQHVMSGHVLLQGTYTFPFTVGSACHKHLADEKDQLRIPVNGREDTSTTLVDCRCHSLIKWTNNQMINNILVSEKHQGIPSYMSSTYKCTCVCLLMLCNIMLLRRAVFW